MLFRSNTGRRNAAKTNPAADQIRVRVTPEQKKQIVSRAKLAGLTMTAYVIKCALENENE